MYVRNRKVLYERHLAPFVRTVYLDFIHSPKVYIQAPGKIVIFAIQSSQVERFLVISKGTEMLRVPAKRLVYVSADGNYANVVTQDNKKQIVSFQLGQVEDMIGDQLGDEGGNFVRLGRGLIINTDFVYLIDIAKQRLILSDCLNCYHELTASREVLIKLKAYIDATINHG